MALPQIRCQLHDHAKQNDNDDACHDKRNGGKLHDNISRNGNGNAMIGRYGGYFEEGMWWAYDTGERCAVFREASNGGKVKVHIIHGLNISQKNSYTYCKNLEVIKNQALRACSSRDRLVGKDHRPSPTATHKDAQARYTSCFKFVTQL